ncbi:MAG: helix-turn-helix transcriptional regulator [Brachyspira sp.]|jgi:DNA-binding helix-turn-helix protein|nr:helix-turn-helix transcriptional regulator [Brachyspira sp.]DAY57690.1 MAG TPA: LAMBDA REPRESSOR (TRIPLE MUTANT)/DNA COMPLEX-DNA COMPLEX, DOUBLE HELIX, TRANSCRIPTION-DNA.1A [Caudoviricetes sp.]
MAYVRKTNIIKKQELLSIIGQLIKEKRIEKEKGILLLGYEYDVSGSSIMLLERGQRDVQVTTLWKLANAFGMSFSEFIQEVEARLPEGFKLIDD